LEGGREDDALNRFLWYVRWEVSTSTDEYIY